MPSDLPPHEPQPYPQPRPGHARAAAAPRPQTPPRLTDRNALRRQRNRAQRQALFLHETAADEIDERLAEVNRTFTETAVVTGQPGFWRARFPRAHVVADDEVLDLERGRHDLVIHAMALHWADDPVGQLVQARRALRPDGLFLGVCPGGRTLAGLRTALAEAEAAVTGGLSPRVLPMADLRDMAGLLQRAGLAMPVADSALLSVSYADALALMRDLRAMGEGNALAARHRRIPPRRLFAETAARYAAANGDGTGRVVARFELIWLAGWAPADNQPQPLRPGSATARLADALGTVESPLPERAGPAGRPPKD